MDPKHHINCTPDDFCVSCEKNTMYPMTCELEEIKDAHEEDCDCSECIEKIMENRHDWDYDIARDNELTHG